jgi:hypothetical protein
MGRRKIIEKEAKEKPWHLLSIKTNVRTEKSRKRNFTVTLGIERPQGLQILLRHLHIHLRSLG